MELKQRKIMMAEYTAKFDELARFEPSMVPSDDAGRMRFMHGLTIDIVNKWIAKSLAHDPTQTWF